jgi:4-hydroxy-3-polyprenylbenzoate decarboxylase
MLAYYAEMSSMSSQKNTNTPLVVAITGASGVVYGVRILQALADANVETHLIMSKAAEMTLGYESDLKAADVRAMADVNYPVQDIGAACASGSFRTRGMIIAPCSMKSLAEIATGVTSSLVSRCAEVMLKERRKLYLMVRETPLTNTHLRNMLHVSEMGGIIAPPVPAFYAKPKDLNAMIDHTVGRCLDLFDIEHQLVRRWREVKQSGVN